MPQASVAGNGVVLIPMDYGPANHICSCRYPTLAGAVVPVFNLLLQDSSGNPTGTPLTLSRTTLPLIFSGGITWWNDTRLVVENPLVQLPEARITLFVRADGSGTTEIFTQALAKFSSEFKTGIGGSDSCKGADDCNWPAEAQLASGNSGVSLAVATTPFSIGYVVLGQAIEDNLSTALLINRAGVAVSASPTSVSFAVQELGGIFSNGRLTADITDPFSSLAWPMSGYTYLIMRSRTPRPSTTCSQRNEVLLFWRWFMLSDAIRDGAGRLGFATLSEFVRERVLGQLLADTLCADGSLAYTGADAQQSEVRMVGAAAMSSVFRTAIGPAYLSLQPFVTVEYTPSVSSASLLAQLPNFAPDVSRTAAAVMTSETLQATVLRSDKAAVVLPAALQPLDFHVQPMAVVGVIPVYSLSDLDAAAFLGSSASAPQQLTLTPETLAGILIGSISHWDDAEIKAANPGAANLLPHLLIQVVVPAFEADSTTVLSAALARMSPTFADFLRSATGTVFGTSTASVWGASSASILRVDSEAQLSAALQQTRGALSFVLTQGSTTASRIALELTASEYWTATGGFAPGAELRGATQLRSVYQTSGGGFVLVGGASTFQACAHGNATTVANEPLQWDSMVPYAAVSGVLGTGVGSESGEAGYMMDFSLAPSGSCWPITTVLHSVTMRAYRANDTIGEGANILPSALPPTSVQGAVTSCQEIGIAERFFSWLHKANAGTVPLAQFEAPLSPSQHERIRQSILTGVTCGGVPVIRLDVLCGIGEELVTEPTPVCVPCSAGTYSLDTRGVCSSCPVGAVCAGGSHLAALPGYWQGNTDVRFFECSPTTACCRSADQETSVQGELLGCSRDSEARCADGRESSSRLCATCEDGFSYVGSICVRCEGANVPIIVVMLLLSLLLVATLLLVQQRFSFKENSFQVLIAFYQMAALLVTPEQAEQSGLAVVTLNFSPIADIQGLNCLFPMSPELAAFLPVLLALLFLVEVAFLMGCEWFFRAYFKVQSDPDEARWSGETWTNKYGVLAWRVTLLSFTAVVLISLQLFRCEDVDGVQVLASYPAVQCNTPVHSALLLMSSILLIVLLLGMPLFITIVVRRQMVDLPHWSPSDLPLASRIVNSIFGHVEDILLLTACRTQKPQALTSRGRRRVSQAIWTPKSTPAAIVRFSAESDTAQHAIHGKEPVLLDDSAARVVTPHVPEFGSGVLSTAAADAVGSALASNGQAAPLQASAEGLRFEVSQRARTASHSSPSAAAASDEAGRISLAAQGVAPATKTRMLSYSSGKLGSHQPKAHKRLSAVSGSSPSLYRLSSAASGTKRLSYDVDEQQGGMLGLHQASSEVGLAWGRRASTQSEFNRAPHVDVSAQASNIDDEPTITIDALVSRAAATAEQQSPAQWSAAHRIRQHQLHTMSSVKELSAWARPGVRLWYATYFLYRRIFMVLVTVYVQDPLHRAFTLFALGLAQLVIHVSHWPYSTKFDNLLDLQLSVLLTAIAGLQMTNSVVNAVPTSATIESKEADVYLLLQILLIVPAVTMGAYAVTVQLPMLFGRAPLRIGTVFLSIQDQERYGMLQQDEDGHGSEMEDFLSHAGSYSAHEHDAPRTVLGSARLHLGGGRSQAMHPQASALQEKSAGITQNTTVRAPIEEKGGAHSAIHSVVFAEHAPAQGLVQLQNSSASLTDSPSSARSETPQHIDSPAASPIAFIASIHFHNGAAAAADGRGEGGGVVSPPFSLNTEDV